MPSSSKYEWQGNQNDDTLTYIGRGELKDTTGIGVPNGQKYTAWMYESKDAAGKKWYLALGVDKLELGDVTTRYGLYYSYDDPRTGGKMKRWLTESGTTRK